MAGDKWLLGVFKKLRKYLQFKKQMMPCKTEKYKEQSRLIFLYIIKRQ